MLPQLENDLVALIQASTLSPKLRAVGILPDMADDTLVKQFGVQAPAVYVSGGPFRLVGVSVSPRFIVAAVAKNARGHQAARHGDGVTIGMLEMADALVAIIHNTSTSLTTWRVLSGDPVQSDAFDKAGLFVHLLVVECSVAPDPALDPATLDAFITITNTASLAAGPNEPTAADTITLPQP
ncbi:MAG: DUF1834 family protein [Nitrospirota bacterium]|nr:DUF1834 family protein [Nitrospirota bacterium]